MHMPAPHSRTSGIIAAKMMYLLCKRVNAKANSPTRSSSPTIQLTCGIIEQCHEGYFAAAAILSHLPRAHVRA